MEKTVITNLNCIEIISNLLKVDQSKVKIHDFKIEKYSDGFPGFLGEYYRLNITFDNLEDVKNEKQFFVKCLPIENIQRRELLRECGIFKKEADVYKYLFPQLRTISGNVKWCPECYFSRDDLMVFEDLKLEDYQILPMHYNLSMLHIHEALKSLAVFHATNIIYEQTILKPQGKTIGDEYKTMLFETSYGYDNPWNMTGIRSLKTVALKKTKYGSDIKYKQLIEEHFINKVCSIFELLENPQVNVPSVVCHRDLWKNNLMYKFERTIDGNVDLSKPKHCIIIDFQIARYLPITLDVIICILLSPRNYKHEDDSIKYYYEQLTIELAKHKFNIDDFITLDQFHKGCKYFKLLPLVMQPIFYSLTNLPSDYIISLLKTDESKYMKICNEFRDDVILEFMEKDQFYQDTMIESVERLIEHLFVKCNET